MWTLFLPPFFFEIGMVSTVEHGEILKVMNSSPTLIDTVTKHVEWPFSKIIKHDFDLSSDSSFTVLELLCI